MKTRILLMVLGTGVLLSLSALRCFQKDYSSETHGLERSKLKLDELVPVTEAAHESH